MVRGGDDEVELYESASFLHTNSDVSKEYFYELSKEFGGFDEEDEEQQLLMYAPLRKKTSKNKPSRHLINTVRSNPEIESFYRFVAENDLRAEAHAILEEYLKEKASKGKLVKGKPADEDIFEELKSKQRLAARASLMQEEAEEQQELIQALEVKEDGEETTGTKPASKSQKKVEAPKKEAAKKGGGEPKKPVKKASPAKNAKPTKSSCSKKSSCKKSAKKKKGRR